MVGEILVDHSKEEEAHDEGEGVVRRQVAPPRLQRVLERVERSSDGLGRNPIRRHLEFRVGSRDMLKDFFIYLF